MTQAQDASLVSVIIPTRNRTTELERCLHSIQKSSWQNVEVIVVDDASTEPTQTTLGNRFPAVEFLRNESRALLSCSRNRGADIARGSYLFFLDDDNILSRDAITELAHTFSQGGRVAVSSPVIYYLRQPAKVWTSYITAGRFPGFYKLHNEIPRRSAPTFAFHNSFMVRRSVFEELGGFDCANFPIRFSELEFALRLQTKGYSAVVNPEAKVWHDIGWALGHTDSRRAYYTERNRMLLLKRYGTKEDFRSYALCILPVLSLYYLLHHSLSTSDGRLSTAESFLRGVVDGLRVSSESTLKR